MKRDRHDLGNFPFFNEDYTFVHPHLVDAVNELRLYLSTPGDAGLITIIGPTGAGKTHVARETVKAIIKEMAQEMMEDLQFLPAVLTRIDLLTAQGKFNWKRFYAQILAVLLHPNTWIDDLGDGREKLQKALRSRRVMYFFCDESAHFISDFAPDDIEGIQKQANVLKSIVQGTGTQLVLIGSYDVSPLITLNGELARRNRRVHMARYRNTPEHRKAFKAVLGCMDKQLCGLLSFSLEEQHADIYEGCVGLIGVLRDWLSLAAKASIRDGKKTISIEALLKVRTPVDVLETILDCAENGEARFDITEEKERAFKERLRAPVDNPR